MRLMFGTQPTSTISNSSTDKEKRALLRRSLTLTVDKIEPDLQGPSAEDRKEVYAGQELDRQLAEQNKGSGVGGKVDIKG